MASLRSFYKTRFCCNLYCIHSFPKKMVKILAIVLALHVLCHVSGVQIYDIADGETKPNAVAHQRQTRTVGYVYY